MIGVVFASMLINTYVDVTSVTLIQPLLEYPVPLGKFGKTTKEIYHR
jgi:hypothetical protein